MSSPAGWYPQPDGQQRYWDGQQWTENFAPGVSPPTPQAAPRKNWFLRHKILTAIGAIFLILFAIGVANPSNTGTKSKTASPSASPTNTPSTTSTPSTSTPEPSLDWSDLATSTTVAMTYAAVCQGYPGGGSWATPPRYAGTTHPMALIGGGPSSLAWAAWETDMQNLYVDTPAAVPAGLRPDSLDAVQLVACVTSGSAPASSCGTYRRKSDGAVGELRRTIGTTSVRILVASSGALIAHRKFESQPLPCNASEIQHSSGPPWVDAANPPGFSDAKGYLAGFTTGPALSY